MQADPDAWKYWLLPSDGSEFNCSVRTSGQGRVVEWGDDNVKASAHECARSCRCATTLISILSHQAVRVCLQARLGIARESSRVVLQKKQSLAPIGLFWVRMHTSRQLQ